MTQKKSIRKRKDIAILLAVLIIVTLINFVGSFVFKRFDLTSEKRYTLSESSRKLLKSLDDIVYIKVYLQGDFNPNFTRLKNETKELLDEFRAYSNGNLEYELINPLDNPSKEETDKIVTVVQQPAEFPGGVQGWTRYLERTLNRDLPVENGAPSGRYAVVVSFIVSRDGSISDVKSENDPGYGTKEEAVRVIQRGPKWKPAVQNGRNVIYRHRQTVVFQVSDE